MSLLSSRRRRSAAAVTAAAGLVVSASLAMGTPAQAAVNYNVTFTGASPAKVSAGTSNRVIILTGTNFDEDQITGIDLGSDPDCANLQSYVVSSSTSISVKTPGAGSNPGDGCAAGAADITINQTNSGTVTRAAAVTFVNPPALAAAKPIITENSSTLLAANQVTNFTTTGGQTIRIKADANTTFSGLSANALSGSFGGKPLTTVGFVAPDGTAQANSAAGTPGNFWIAKTATALAANATPTLTISQNGVSKTFQSTDIGNPTIVGVPTVTSLDVTSGKSNTATTVKITGTNFGTTVGDWTVNFCGLPGVVTAATATVLTVTTPTNVGGNASGLGASTYAGVCPVVVVGANNGTSPLSEKSNFTYLTS